MFEKIIDLIEHPENYQDVEAYLVCGIAFSIVHTEMPPVRSMTI